MTQSSCHIRQTKEKIFRRNKKTTYEKLSPGNTNSREQVIYTKRKAEIPGYLTHSSIYYIYCTNDVIIIPKGFIFIDLK